jgi:hypothetical protein
MCDRFDTAARGGGWAAWASWPLGRTGRCCGLLAAALAAACSPALDWREIRRPEAALVAQFPCRPARQDRTVPVAGQTVKMSLQVCDAGGASFALTLTEVEDPGRVPVVMEALRDAATRNLGAVVAAPTAWPVPGMTPQSKAGQWRLSGRLPDGQALDAVMAITSRGGYVVQLSVSSARLGEAQFQPFLDGVRFAP